MDLEPSIKELTKGAISSCVGPGVATIDFLDSLERFPEKTREYIVYRTADYARRLVDSFVDLKSDGWLPPKKAKAKIAEMDFNGYPDRGTKLSFWCSNVPFTVFKTPITAEDGIVAGYLVFLRDSLEREFKGEQLRHYVAREVLPDDTDSPLPVVYVTGFAIAD